jgi:phosphate transport system substrate-binding protein
MKPRFLRMIGVIAAISLILAACGGDGNGSDATDPTTDVTEPNGTEPPANGGDMDPVTGLPVIDPLSVTGDIAAAGSSTVFPLTEAVSDMWADEGGPAPFVDSIGSGAGFERFCVDGESDISNASRPIEDEEVTQCQSIGRDPIEFRVGTDALAIAVSTGNYFVESITLEELATLFSGADTWADVNPAWPAHPVALFSPGTDSGTFDYFVEEIYEEDEEPILNSGAQLSEDDNVLVQGVSEDGCNEGNLSTTCAVAYFGFAYFVENDDVLKAVSVEGVVPSAESVDAGEYPLARPLFMYSALPILEEKPQVASFLTYYLNSVSSLIGDVGYFPAPQADMQAGIDALAAYWEANG